MDAKTFKVISGVYSICSYFGIQSIEHLFNWGLYRCTVNQNPTFLFPSVISKRKLQGDFP